MKLRTTTTSLNTMGSLTCWFSKKLFSIELQRMLSMTALKAIMELSLLMDKLDLVKHSLSLVVLRDTLIEALFLGLSVIFLVRRRRIQLRNLKLALAIWKSIMRQVMIYLMRTMHLKVYWTCLKYKCMKIKKAILN